ncbi:MAG: Icc-related predicted phosphoesterase [Myxococcota bacterium]|jgi:Icc-related predicted phosphoesterase
MEHDKKTFAVFGDVHGRITLMLMLSRAWEAATGRTLDGVLQVGDMGAYPDLSRIDDATRRHAARDSDELGFSQYVHGCAEGADLLDHDGWPVVWMRGNHEDFDYLAGFHKPTAVDPWQRLLFLPDGQQHTLAGVRIGAMGGMAPRQERRGRGRTMRKKFRKEQASGDPRLVPRRLINTTFVDTVPHVLLTHAAPKTPELPFGSELLTNLCRRIHPRIHLFGHHHVALDPTTGPGGSTLIGLDHLDFRRNQLQARCWGILELEGNEVRWTWGDTFEWTRTLSRENYRQALRAVFA